MERTLEFRLVVCVQCGKSTTQKAKADLFSLPQNFSVHMQENVTFFSTKALSFQSNGLLC